MKLTDHINHNGLDNTRINLREVTSSQSMMNRRKWKGCSSPYIGVSWRNDIGKWYSYINIDGKRKFLGHFTDEIEAALVRDTAARKYHKEYATLNFP